MMCKRPRLISVRMIPWEMNRDIFGIACEYDDGVTEREMWGTQEETELAVCLRSREIVAEVNLKRA